MICFPIYRLNGVITKALKKMISLDLASGIREGLAPMIHFIDEQGGPLSTVAKITERTVMMNGDGSKRYVTISAAYSQILWMICSIVMRNHDSVAINNEIERMSQEEYAKYQQELLSDTIIARYERNLQEEKKVFSDSAEMLNQIETLSTRKLLDEEIEQLYAYDMTSVIGVGINSLYVFAMSFILLHEFSHHSLNHNLKQEGTKEEENEADHNAYWTLYSDLQGKERQTALLGILCALVSLIFVNTSLEDDGIHPLPIERIFHFYDIIKEESPNYAGLMCHLFYAWAVYTHDDNMPSLDGSYEETIENIRNYMVEKEAPNNKLNT